jgi:hypothetical protein
MKASLFSAQTSVQPLGEKAANGGYITELESIRGLAALLVVIYHIPKWNSVLEIGLINRGYLMVDLFFVLSGFVIYSAYADKISKWSDLLRFQFLRFGRLYPVHVVFLSVYVIIEIAKYMAQTYLGLQSPNTHPFGQNSVGALLEQVFLIQAIGPTGHATTFNGPAWSISVEFYTYLVFALVTLTFRQHKGLVFLGLTLGAFILLVGKWTYGFDDFVHCLAGFFLGCLTALATVKSKVKIPPLLSFLVFIATVFFLHFLRVRSYGLGIYFLSSLLVASLVLSESGLLKRMLSFAPIRWLGKVSYSLYMCHFALFWCANQVARVALHSPQVVGADGISLPQMSVGNTLIVAAATIAVALVLSSLIFRFVETPFRERSRRFVAQTALFSG